MHPHPSKTFPSLPLLPVNPPVRRHLHLHLHPLLKHTSANPPPSLGTSALHALTVVLILYPIAAFFVLVACLFGFCGAGFSRIGAILTSLCVALATLFTLVVWVVDMSLWGIVRNRLRSNGITAEYGNVNWIVLGALVCSSVSALPPLDPAYPLTAVAPLLIRPNLLNVNLQPYSRLVYRRRPTLLFTNGALESTMRQPR